MSKDKFSIPGKRKKRVTREKKSCQYCFLFYVLSSHTQQYLHRRLFYWSGIITDFTWSQNNSSRGPSIVPLVCVKRNNMMKENSNESLFSLNIVAAVLFKPHRNIWNVLHNSIWNLFPERVSKRLKFHIKKLVYLRLNLKSVVPSSSLLLHVVSLRGTFCRISSVRRMGKY